MSNIDVKYIGVPNVCFSLTNENSEKEMLFKEQRTTRGFDDSETWSLRDTIANFIIPRLERYEEIANEKLIREPELTDNINYFLQAMKLIARDEGSCLWDKEEEEIVKKGLDAFPKIFMTLWW